MTSTNIKSDRTEMRHCKQKMQEGKGESQRDEIFELVKEIVSVERRKGKGLGYTVNSRLWGRMLSRWPRSLVPSCFMALTGCQ